MRRDLRLGLLTPLFAFLLACDMGVAILGVHLPKGASFVGGPGAYELPLMYLTLMVAFLLTGPGSFSIDGLLARRRVRSHGMITETELDDETSLAA